MTDKLFLDSRQLLNDSVQLALNIMEANFIPDLLVGVWRGGTPVAISIHEVMTACGHSVPHTVISAASYKKINLQGVVSLSGVEAAIKDFPLARRILLVDDVFDTGRTLQAIVNAIHRLGDDRTLDIRVATPWYKPERQIVALQPDFWLHKTGRWLVFPHELAGLTKDELLEGKNELNPAIRQALLHKIT